MHTKLRYIKAKDPDEITLMLRKLKFKVEVKTVYFAQGFHWLWFTIREEDAMENVEL